MSSSRNVLILCIFWLGLLTVSACVDNDAAFRLGENAPPSEDSAPEDDPPPTDPNNPSPDESVVDPDNSTDPDDTQNPGDPTDTDDPDDPPEDENPTDPNDPTDPDDPILPSEPPEWFDPQPPISRSPHNEWRFIPVEGAVCANGKQSGFFINFSDHSEDLLIFLLGGGICYDEISCGAHLGLVNDGMGDNPLAWWMGNGERTQGVFQRDNGLNPFRDASYVVLPHCTVDFHAADKESNYIVTGKIQQRGYRNVQRAMNHVVPTFQDPERNITIAGFSAGGVGSVANYHQIASAFESYGHEPPFLINDGGPIQPRPYFSINSHNAIRNGWRLDETIETWCETCKDKGYHEALYWIHQLHPGVRSSQICAYGDGVVMALYTLFDAIGNAPRFQIDLIPTPPFTYTHMKPGLDALRTWSEGFETEGIHRNLLYHRGDRHGALSVAPIHDDFTPAIVPFLNAQLNRQDMHWFSPHF